ncbi:hypothetical protein SBA4_3010017 [Candidatus Sulfopaludibacter sp. SbA4]|nr:hypothetical protein SBA4_3010017 [Candidatus Sulfopaludibacter sp. SbA4]
MGSISAWLSEGPRCGSPESATESPYFHRVNRDVAYHTEMVFLQVYKSFHFSDFPITFDTGIVSEGKWCFLPGGSNSAGRVRPCQGRCRRFESGLPLHTFRPPAKADWS